MDKTLKRILTFVMLAVLIHCSFIAMHSFLDKKSAPLEELEVNYFNSADHLNYLFLGHSRGYRGIDTQLIPNSFNFCTPGESHIYSYYKLKYLLEKDSSKFKTVVLTAGFGSFSARGIQNRINSDFWIRYVDYSEIDELSSVESSAYSFQLRTMLFPYFKYPANKIDQLIRHKNKEQYSYDLTQKTDKEKAKLADFSIQMNMNKRQLYDELCKIYLLKTIELCGKHNKKLIYLKYPVTSYYSAAVERNFKNLSDIKQFDTLIQSNPNCVLLDFEKLYENQDHLFRDVNHLNKKGSKEFSSFINSKLEQL